MSFKFKNLKKSTPAKFVKIGVALVSVSAFIAGYGLTQGNEIVGYIGLGLGVIGTLFVNMFNDV